MLNKLGHVLDKPVDPKAQEEESPLRWEKVDVDAVKYAKGMKLRPSTGYNQIREQLPRTSLMAVQYYQFDEVWHTLYNRAEMRHLKDPENTDFVDDEARNRQVGVTKQQHTAMHDATHTLFVLIDEPLWSRFQPCLGPRLQVKNFEQIMMKVAMCGSVTHSEHSSVRVRILYSSRTMVCGNKITARG